ncbi:MAG: TetR/AcrR family transcriptional regulator [candidate division WOR-3 bacterium]
MTEQSVIMENKNKILESAISVFLEKGFYNARVEDIAEKAGIAKGTVYLYFKDKRDLFLSSIRYEIEKFYVKIEGIIKGNLKPQRKLKNLLFIIYSNFYERKKYYESAIRLWPGELGKEIIKTILPYLRKILKVIGSVLREGENLKVFSIHQNIYSDSVMILGIIRAASMAEDFFGKKVSFEKAWNYIKKILDIKEGG